MDTDSSFRILALLTPGGVVLHGTQPGQAGRTIWEAVRPAGGQDVGGDWCALLARALQSGAPQPVGERLMPSPPCDALRVSPLQHDGGNGPLLALEMRASEADESARREVPEKDLMLTCGQRLAKLGSWIWDAEADRLTWSEETQRILGMAPSEVDGSLEGFLQHVHAADRAGLRGLVQRAVQGQRHYSYRYRFHGKAGPAGERLIAGEGEGQFDPSGRLLRIVGTVMDVTQRERERQAIRESEARFRSLVELSTDWYWEQDAQFRFTSFSGGRFEHHEHRDGTIGKRRWELPGTPTTTSWEEHRALLDAHRPFRDLEYWVQDGDRQLWITVAGEPFWDADGNFRGYRGTARDITQRKLADQRERQFTAMLRMATRLGRMGAWSMDVRSREIAWTEGGRIAYSREGTPARNLDELLDRLSPPSRGEAQAAFDACARKGTSFDIEVHLDAASHPALWVRLIGETDPSAEIPLSRIQGTIQDVTARRLAAQHARDLRACRPNGEDPRAECLITLDRMGRVTHLNREAEALLRRSLAELAGRVLWDAVPALRTGTLESASRRVAETSAPGEFDELFDALGHWLRVRIFPSPQGFAVYLRDITDPSSVREAFLETQEQFRNLFEHSIDGVVCLGPGGRITRANRAACALLGRDDSHLQGLAFESLMAPGETRLAQLLEIRRAVGRVTGRLTVLREQPPGAFEAEIASAEYADAHGNLHSFVVLRDISRRLRDEQEIKALNADLAARVQARTAELEAMNAELKAFAHSLAHDLRAPIGAIDGFADMAQWSLSNGASDKAAYYLERVRASARKMDEFTEGLLSLARVSQAPMERRPVDLTALAREVLQDLGEREPQRVVRWRVQPRLATEGDPRLLRIALENLLGNAWKFTRAQPEAEIEFTCRCEAAGPPTFRVRDNGAGFDMQYADKLFSSFQRLHNQSEFPGTGIGLANVRRIVLRHGGNVWAEAAPDRGASFYFTLGDGGDACTEERPAQIAQSR